MKLSFSEFKNKFSKFTMSQSLVILFFSIFIVLFHNFTFFKKTLEVYFETNHIWIFIISLGIVLGSVLNLVFNLLTFKRSIKPTLIIVLLLSSMTSYFIDHYSVVLDEIMLLSIGRTNTAEAFDLFSIELVFYFLFLGILPSFLIYKITIPVLESKKEILIRLRNIGISIILIFVMLLISGKFYASFFRENKPLRYYTNPTYFFYSTGKQFSKLFKKEKTEIVQMGRDSKILEAGNERELIILVIGETARADRFSLNGYEKDTNPFLKKEDVVSFSNMSSCGTSTAISVPCMFSKFGRENYSDEKGKTTENLLDLLNNTKKVNILWRDNNSDSKGVALRVPFENYKEAPINKVCDIECRDEGMLLGLQEYIDAHPTGDIFIILHQMGNHGPAYYKRYPKEFEKFKPTCQTNQLEKCSNLEINNAYDNAILYTDYFLSKVIGLLKKNDLHFETAMFYVSDHGESLGEKGVYLHGLPYFMAPVQQKIVGSVLWLDDKMKSEIDYAKLQKRAANPYSHDNLFHTILGLFEVETSEYVKSLDIIRAE